MISSEIYQKLKNNVEKIEKEYEQSVGAKQQIMETLKKEFKCFTIIQAKKMLKKLKLEKKENESKFWKEYRDFKKQFRAYNKKLEKPDN